MVICNGQGPCGFRNKHYFFRVQWWCLTTDRFVNFKIHVILTLFFSKDCQNSASQAITLDLDYSLVFLYVKCFCLIIWNWVKRKRKWAFVNWDLTTNENTPYLHQKKSGKFIHSFLDLAGTLQFSEPSNEQIDWGYQLSKLMTSSGYWWIIWLHSLCLWGWWGGKQQQWRRKTLNYEQCPILGNVNHSRKNNKLLLFFCF